MQVALALLMVFFCVLYLAMQIWRFWRRRGESPCSHCRHAGPAKQGRYEIVQLASPSNGPGKLAQIATPRRRSLGRNS